VVVVLGAEPLDRVGLSLHELVALAEEACDVVNAIGFGDEGDEEREGNWCRRVALVPSGIQLQARLGSHLHWRALYL
jgi:hypothetical protein